MSSQAELIKAIKEWITIDNEIRNINKELRTRKDKLKKNIAKPDENDERK